MTTATNTSPAPGIDVADIVALGICVIDCDLNVVQWNRTLERWTEIARDDAVGMNLGTRFPRLSSPIVRERLANVFEAGHTAIFSAALHKQFLPIPDFSRATGEQMVQRAVVRPMDHNRQYALVMIEDVTAQFHQVNQLRKERDLLQKSEAMLQTNQRKLRQAKQISERALRAKGQFLSNMSHEIRTPLGAIMGFTDLLTDTIHDAETLATINTIRRNGEHLLMIVNDILDLSKIEAGMLVVEKLECSPHDVIEAAVSLMRAAADAKGLQLDSRIVGKIPARAETDPTRLRQIVLNLLSNAIKFTASGSVRVTTEMDQSGRLLIRVRDTGRGMSNSQIERIFQPFEQADSSMVREFGGTGLGLSISRELAGMLGGALTAESELGRGSCFQLTTSLGQFDAEKMLHESCRVVPSSDRTEAINYVAESGNSAPLSCCRVLLAEDTRCMQHLIVRLCQKFDATVVCADDGHTAYELATQAQVDAEPFDVILMDMQMPLCDGYSATRRLRNDGYHGTIVALTAHALEGDREKCLDAGCNDYVTKPIDRTILSSVLKKYAPVPSA